MSITFLLAKKLVFVHIRTKVNTILAQMFMDIMKNLF